MSANNVSEDASIEELSGIGPARAESLGVETVSELAESSAQHLFNECDLSPSEVEDAVDAARDVVGESMEATVYTDEVQDPEPESSATSESFGDDVDAFIDAGSTSVDNKTPEECDTIAILAGDGVFNHDGAKSGMSAEEHAGLVAMKMDEFGFDPEVVYALGSGMGRVAVNDWAGFTKNQTDMSLPELRQIKVQPSGDYPDGDDYRARNERLLDEVDGICVVANGDYIGMWVNMVSERDDVIIRTPDQDE